jgi:hypothetical protein
MLPGGGVPCLSKKYTIAQAKYWPTPLRVPRLKRLLFLPRTLPLAARPSMLTPGYRGGLEEIELTAYHEAGHGVVACLLRRGVRYVTIEPGGGSHGHTALGQTPRPPREGETRRTERLRPADVGLLIIRHLRTSCTRINAPSTWYQSTFRTALRAVPVVRGADQDDPGLDRAARPRGI